MRDPSWFRWPLLEAVVEGSPVVLTGLLALLEDVALNKVPAAGQPATVAGS